tara:strand:- start:198 stop:329 length:132 start_codon:yes stop_codon:yes gene_type:complete
MNVRLNLLGYPERCNEEKNSLKEQTERLPTHAFTMPMNYAINL